MTNEDLELEADRLLAEGDDNILDRTDGETVACKIGKKEKEAFRRLCEKKLGCTMNEALQMCIDMLRRYMEDRYNLSDELQQMINLFEGMQHWKDHINLADPVERKTIIAAIYILAQTDKVGRRMVMVDGVEGELHHMETFNLQHILECFVENYDPRLYREVRLVGAAMGCQSIDQILRRLVAEYKPESEDDIELRKMFEDNRRGEYGQHDLPEGGPYKRTMVNSMETLEARQERYWREHQTVLDFDAAAEETINNTF